MVQLKLLSGKMAGAVLVARHFPWRIGRAAAADCRLEESGIWDQHLVLDLVPVDGFKLQLQPDALGTINGKPFKEMTVRNGDVIEIGSVRMQFWLAETPQMSLRGREFLTWLAIAFVTVGQAILIYCLPR